MTVLDKNFSSFYDFFPIFYAFLYTRIYPGDSSGTICGSASLKNAAGAAQKTQYMNITIIFSKKTPKIESRVLFFWKTLRNK